jgi:hypothetical protein
MIVIVNIGLELVRAARILELLTDALMKAQMLTRNYHEA